MATIAGLSRRRYGFESRWDRPKVRKVYWNFPGVLKNSTNGLACTKAGEEPLQGFCGEFDSLRVHEHGETDPVTKWRTER